MFVFDLMKRKTDDLVIYNPTHKNQDCTIETKTSIYKLGYICPHDLRQFYVKHAVKRRVKQKSMVAVGVIINKSHLESEGIKTYTSLYFCAEANIMFSKIGVSLDFFWFVFFIKKKNE